MTHHSREKPDERFPMEDIDQLLDWVSSQTGLSFRGQRENVSETILRYMDSSGDTSSHECRLRLMKDQAAFDDLIGALTIGETYFFRDQGQFELIAGEFINAMEKLRPNRHRIRAWSAGCASGEEAWSLAALFADTRFAKGAHVLGTDISRPALIRAQAGRYRPWSMRGDAADQMLRWMKECGDDVLEVSENLRQHVSFEYLNLAADMYPSFTSNTVGLDLILCRNVLIYFDQQTIRNVAARLYSCLSPGAWLITGASDPSLTDFADFEVRSTRSGRVYVRPENLTGSTVPERPAAAPQLRQHSATSRDTKTDFAARSRSADRQLPSSQVSAESSSAMIEEAELALRQGAYVRVLKLTTDPQVARGCVLRVRALANLDTALAEEVCSEVLPNHPSHQELLYLHAILLTELNRYGEAVKAAKRVVSLNRDLAVGQMALGTALQRIGDREGARRAFRSVKRICESSRADELVPLADGEQAGRLAESVARHLSLLDAKLPRDGSSAVRW